MTDIILNSLLTLWMAGFGGWFAWRCWRDRNTAGKIIGSIYGVIAGGFLWLLWRGWVL